MPYSSKVDHNPEGLHRRSSFYDEIRDRLNGAEFTGKDAVRSLICHYGVSARQQYFTTHVGREKIVLGHLNPVNLRRECRLT